MKQLIFMFAAMLTGTLGSIAVHPYLAMVVYYMFAVLRPQFIWQWSLPDFAWSFYVAITGVIATIAWRAGVLGDDSEELEKKINVSNWIYACFAFWIILSYFSSLNKDMSYPYLIDYIKIFSMYVVACIVFTSMHKIWVLFITLTLVICYIAYEINEIYLTTGYMYVFKLGYGGMDNNGAAVLLAMGVPLCVYLWDGMRHWVRWVFILFVPVIIHAVLTSYSRGGMLAVIVVFPLYFVRCRSRLQFSMISIITIAMLPFLAGKEIRDRFYSIEQHEMDDSANQRKMAWAVAIRLANENPFFGVGIRNASSFTYLSGNEGMHDRAIHSQWLQTAADSGYVALVFYVALILSVFYCCHRVRVQMRGDGDIESIRCTVMVNGCEGALLTYCIGATFLSMETFELPYILFFLGAQIYAVAQAKLSSQ